MNSTYNKYAREIVRSERRDVGPVSELNFNRPNNFIRFDIDHGDAFYDGGMQYKIEGKLVKKSDGSDYAAKSTIKLVDNFPAFLFSRIEVRKHKTLIDTVEHPGITSTVKGLVSYSNTDKNILEETGFKSTFESGGKFQVLGKLSHLGLGFFDHLKYPMFKGGFEITFIRAEDNDAIFHWKGTGTGATDPEDGKVVIESFVLRVPLVSYAPESNIKLVNELKTLSDNGGLAYNYYQWECIEKKGVTGSGFSFDITNLFRSIYNPKFIFIVLQRDRLNTQSSDPSKFDSENIKNYVVKVDRLNYPEEPQKLDITNDKYRVMYDAYADFRRANFRDENIYLDGAKFIKDYPIMCVNTALHPVNIANSRSKIQINLDFTNPIGDAAGGSGTIAYVIVLSETSFKYDITKEAIQFY